MQERAHAKVNLVLSVTPGICEGAYHEVRTVMCALELHDEVELCELAAGEGLVFSCEPDPLPAGADPATNLAYRAAVDMAEAFEKPLDMSVALRKRVPSQAGLGGGSSDAAAVMRGLARMWQIDLEDERVVRLAQSLGADVAFFLYEVPSYLDGRGDVLRETFAPFSVPVVLVKPDQGVSTGACYRLLDEMATPATQVEPMLEALQSRRSLLSCKTAALARRALFCAAAAHACAPSWATLLWPSVFRFRHASMVGGRAPARRWPSAPQEACALPVPPLAPKTEGSPTSPTRLFLGP